jgi:hypothetical protein
MESTKQESKHGVLDNALNRNCEISQYRRSLLSQLSKVASRVSAFPDPFSEEAKNAPIPVTLIEKIDLLNEIGEQDNERLHHIIRHLEELL